MQLSDRVSGLSIAALGVVAAYAGSLLPPVPGQQVGPNVFPLVVGIGLVICGVLIALRIGHRFEEEAEAAVADMAPPEPARARGPLFGLRALIPPALLIFYWLAVETLGFILTAGLMVLVLARFLGANWRLAVGLAIVAPPFVHLAFYKLLRVPLAAGLVPMPW
ncbi:tripartite tricarboxylate transporter TctB family protein [Enterovirga sp. CN4-39]|uniref:tripartite tricarboxylate transporter TctB family protein n=1 Tax=Enterovirga sp. CN4-39 TaxID=3400910 RepID=UPI003C129D74